jgi:hypothetical protein
MAERKPRAGSAAWERTLQNDPAYVQNTIASLAKRAEGGDAGAVADLRAWLQQFPELRATVRGLDELAAKAERAWEERLCGTDELAKEAVRAEVAAFKAELLGPTPGVLERLLANTVVVGYLNFQWAARVASLRADHHALKEARDRLLSAAQKRLQAAVKGWQLVAEKRAKGARPKGELKLFDPDAA